MSDPSPLGLLVKSRGAAVDTTRLALAGDGVAVVASEPPDAEHRFRRGPGRGSDGQLETHNARGVERRRVGRLPPPRLARGARPRRGGRGVRGAGPAAAMAMGQGPRRGYAAGVGRLRRAPAPARPAAGAQRRLVPGFPARPVPGRPGDPGDARPAGADSPSRHGLRSAPPRPARAPAGRPRQELRRGRPSPERRDGQDQRRLHQFRPRDGHPEHSGRTRPHSAGAADRRRSVRRGGPGPGLQPGRAVLQQRHRQGPRLRPPALPAGRHPHRRRHHEHGRRRQPGVGPRRSTPFTKRAWSSSPPPATTSANCRRATSSSPPASIA